MAKIVVYTDKGVLVEEFSAITSFEDLADIGETFVQALEEAAREDEELEPTEIDLGDVHD